MKDQRFKVSLAIAEAGLTKTDAGRQAILAARPMRPTRTDNLTTHERSGLPPSQAVHHSHVAYRGPIL